MEWLMLITLTMALSMLGACLIVLAYFFLRNAATQSGSPLPPGPPAMPIIGNLLDMPRRSAWLAYKELSRRYGVSLNVQDIG